MQLYKHNTSRDGTHKQAGSRSVDAVLFAEELTEIKTQNLNMNHTQIRLITILGIKEKFLT